MASNIANKVDTMGKEAIAKVKDAKAELENS